MRSVREWIGKTDDEQIPARIKIRVFDAYKGICQCGCGRKIGVGEQFQIDHIVALANGGAHAERNLQPVLTEHHKNKTKADMKIKRKITRTRTKHLGQRKAKRKIPSRKFGGAFSRRRRTGARSRKDRAGNRSSRGVTSFRHGLERFDIKIETARLIIERQRMPDAGHLQAMNDNHHMRFSEQRWEKHTLVSQRLAIVASAASEFRSAPWLLFYIRNKPGNVANAALEVVGSMGVNLDLNNRTADLSIMVLPRFTGAGVGTEAWIAMVDYWLKQTDLVEKIEAGCMEANDAMYALFKKAGMTFEGSRPGHFYVGGEGFGRRGVSYWGIP